MIQKKTFSKALIAGMGVVSSFYVDPALNPSKSSNSMPEKSFSLEESQLLLEKLAPLTDAQAQSSDQLFLAGIRQRATADFTSRFEGKTAEEIEILAGQLGFDVEWQAV